MKKITAGYLKGEMPENADFKIVVDDRLMYLSVTVWHFKKILKEKNKGDLLTVYLYLHFIAQTRKSNSVWANVNYLRKMLNISRGRIQAARKGLINLGLIQDVKIFNKQTGKIKGFYTILGFAPTKKKRDHIIQTNTEILKFIDYYQKQDNHPPENRVPGKKKNKKKKTTRPENQRLENRAPNILRILKNKKNILRILKNKGGKPLSFGKTSKGFIYLWDAELKYYLNTKGIKRNSPDEFINKELKDSKKLTLTDPLHPNNKFYLYVATKLKDINENYYDHNLFPDPKSWVTDIRLLAQSDIGCNGTPTEEIKKRFKNVLNHYSEVIGQEYSHILKSGKSFRSKFFDVEEAIKRKNNKSITPHTDYLKNDFIILEGENSDD